MRYERAPGAAATARGGYSQHRLGWRSYSGDTLHRHVDFARVNDLACARLADVCAWLFPAGVREGREFVVGSLRGEAGRSLKVRLTGSRAGVWRDFATGFGGRDPVALVAAVTGVPQRDAAVALARWLGVSPWR